MLGKFFQNFPHLSIIDLQDFLDPSIYDLQDFPYPCGPTLIGYWKMERVGPPGFVVEKWLLPFPPSMELKQYLDGLDP